MFLKSILFAVFALFFIGCSPKYDIKKIYIPPIGQKYKSEIDKCRENEVRCQKKCYKKYQKCKKNALFIAEKIYRNEKNRYNKLYDIYKDKLDKYKYQFINWQRSYDEKYKDWQYFQSLCKKSSDRYACKRKDELRRRLIELNHNRPIRPKAPNIVSFEEIFSREKSTCQKDCGCERDYDICFLNLGGSIKIEKICIENCD